MRGEKLISVYNFCLQVFRGLSLAKLPSNVAFQTWGPECRFAAVAVKVDKNTDGTSWFAAISGPKNTLHYKYPDSKDHLLFMIF